MSDGGESQLSVYRSNANEILRTRDQKDPEAAALTEQLVDGMTKAQLVNQLIVLARFARHTIETRENKIAELEDTITLGKEAEKRHVERINDLSTQLNKKTHECNGQWQELLTLREENQRLDLLSEKRLSRKFSRKAGELWGKLDDKTQQP